MIFFRDGIFTSNPHKYPSTPPPVLPPPPLPVVNTTAFALNSTPKNVLTPVTSSLAPTSISDTIDSRTCRLGVLTGGGGRVEGRKGGGRQVSEPPLNTEKEIHNVVVLHHTLSCIKYNLLSFVYHHILSVIFCLSS